MIDKKGKYKLILAVQALANPKVSKVYLTRNTVEGRQQRFFACIDLTFHDIFAKFTNDQFQIILCTYTFMQVCKKFDKLFFNKSRKYVGQVS